MYALRKHTLLGTLGLRTAGKLCRNFRHEHLGRDSAGYLANTGQQGCSACCSGVGILGGHALKI